MKSKRFFTSIQKTNFFSVGVTVDFYPVLSIWITIPYRLFGVGFTIKEGF